MTQDVGAVVDGHIHQWDPFTTPREASGPAKILRRAPFLTPLLLRVFPRSSREFFGETRYILNPYLPADYQKDGSVAGVGTVVHIEAGWHTTEPLGPVGETRWIAALPFGVGGAPGLGAIVVHADPSQPDVSALLDAHLEASPLVRGVRCMAAHSPDPGIMNWTKSEHKLTEPAFLRNFAAVAERGLSFEIWVYGHQLPDAVVLAREYPDTTFVLDHYASPAGALGPFGKHTGRTVAERKDILDRWRDGISALAELRNVVAKHSGTGMPVLGGSGLPRDRLRDAVAPLLTHLQSAFGPDRTLWSSNYPVDKPNVALPESISLLREVLGERFDHNRILRDNARRVYRI